MVKSATGRSTDRTRPARSRAAGFTLIEILVVIVILAIMAAMVLLSMRTLRAEDPAETEARRLTALVEFVAEEALVQGRDFGVEFFEDGYRFLSWDPDAGLWSVVADEAAMRFRPLPPPLRLGLAVDGREVPVFPEDRRRDRTAEQLVPQVAIYSSGEFTAFELFLATDSVRDAWVLRSRSHGGVELLEPERWP